MNDTQKKWIVDVKENPENPDECLIDLPPEALKLSGLEPGDIVKWEPLDNGAWTITKVVHDQPTKFVLVDAVSNFRVRYLVELSASEPAEYALDTVVMGEATEFSQKYLDETIVSHRVVTRDEALFIARQDNDYVASWSDDAVIEKFFTTCGG